MMANQIRKIGRVRISRLFVESAFAEGLNPFDRAVVFHVDYNYPRDEFQYEMAHPDFKELAEGEIMPDYTGTFVDGRRSPSWSMSR